MADTVCKQVKLVLLMGVTANKIEAAIRGSQFYQEGAPELVHVGSMEEAVQEARKRAKTGILLHCLRLVQASTSIRTLKQEDPL